MNTQNNKNEIMKKYKIPNGKKGITDLKGTHAFVSSMQGDHSWTNNTSEVNEYLMKSFHFKDCNTQEEIDERVKQNTDWNEAYIKELVRNGEYGEEYETGYVYLEENPLFDKPVVETDNPHPLSSYSFVFIDYSQDKQLKK